MCPLVSPCPHSVVVTHVDFLVAAGHCVPRPGARRCGVGTMDECSGHVRFERLWGWRKPQSLSLLSLKSVGTWLWTLVNTAKGSGRKVLVTLSSLFSFHPCSLLPSSLHTLSLKLLQQNQPFSPTIAFEGAPWGCLLGMMPLVAGAQGLLWVRVSNPAAAAAS